MVQELADYAQKFTYYASLMAPDPFTYFIAKGQTMPDYYYA